MSLLVARGDACALKYDYIVTERTQLGLLREEEGCGHAFSTVA